jgi:hypothetical protein
MEHDDRPTPLPVFKYRGMVVLLKEPLTPEEEIAMKEYIDYLREQKGR